MALRKAWQKMKRTLSSETRQVLVTSELWEIFLAKDQKDHPDIEKLLLERQKRMEKILANGHKIPPWTYPSKEKGNIKVPINRYISIISSSLQKNK